MTTDQLTWDLGLPRAEAWNDIWQHQLAEQSERQFGTTTRSDIHAVIRYGSQRDLIHESSVKSARLDDCILHHLCEAS